MLLYIVSSNNHVLYDCAHYNGAVGDTDTLTDIIRFLQGNPDAFCFQNNIF